MTSVVGGRFRGASWGDDDTIVFGSGDDRSLLRVSAAGGAPQSVTIVKDAEDELDHAWMDVLPGGEDLLFTIRPGGQRPARIVTQSVATGERTEIGEGTSPTYVRTGHVLFARQRSLWAVPFDLDRRAVTGEATPVIEDLQVDFSGAAHYAVADDGTLVYARGAAGGLGTRRLVWVDRMGREEPVRGLGNGDYQTVRISPDSGRIAFVDGVGGSMDVWTYDVQRTTRTLLTIDPADDVNPLWTADGEAILFGSNRDSRAGLYRVNADGTGAVERLHTDDSVTSLHPHDVSSDGRLLFSTFPFPINLAALSIDGDRPGTPDVFLASEFNENHATLSPDGAWLAYSSDRSGRSDIYVERFPNLGSRRLISTNGGSFPLWSPDGQELFYVADGGQLMSVPTATQPTLVAVGAGSPGPAERVSRLALFWAQRAINQHLVGRGRGQEAVHTRLLYDTEVQSFGVHVVPTSLLGALWLQCALAIAGDRTYRRCASCQEWFWVSPEGGGKRRHSDYCGSTCKVREWRKRKRKRTETTRV